MGSLRVFEDFASFWTCTSCVGCSWACMLSYKTLEISFHRMHGPNRASAELKLMMFICVMVYNIFSINPTQTKVPVKTRTYDFHERKCLCKFIVLLSFSSVLIVIDGYEERSPIIVACIQLMTKSSLNDPFMSTHMVFIIDVCIIMNLPNAGNEFLVGNFKES